MVRGIRITQHIEATSLAPPGDPDRPMRHIHLHPLHHLPGAQVIKGFGDFIKNGNIVDLAVAVVIGTAFAALVTQFTTSFLTPLIAVTTGGGKVGGKFVLAGQTFSYGAFIGAIITFLNTAAVVYFLVVLPMNKILRRSAKPALEDTPEAPTQTELLAEIRDLLRAQRLPDQAPIPTPPQKRLPQAPQSAPPQVPEVAPEVAPEASG